MSVQKFGYPAGIVSAVRIEDHDIMELVIE